LLQIPLIPARKFKLHQSVKTKNHKIKIIQKKIIENLLLPPDNVALNHVGNLKFYTAVSGIYLYVKELPNTIFLKQKFMFGNLLSTC